MVSVHVLTLMLSFTSRVAAVQVTNKASTFQAPATPAPAPACAKPGSRPDLIPPTGMFRGSTNINATAYESMFGVKMHIMRLFPTKPYAFTEAQKGFAAAGGILMISPQPENWSTFPTSDLEELADMVKGVAPSQVMVAIGYEPDGHAEETAVNGPIFGTAAEWVDLFQRSTQVFKDNGATNAVWALDFSTDLAMRFDPAAHILWPGDDYVDVLLWNVFQNQSTTDCSVVTEMVYKQFEAASAPGYNYVGVPWGLGAWGSMSENDHQPNREAIPLADRKSCYYGLRSLFNGGAYSRMKYSIYYNSDLDIVQTAGTPNPNYAEGYNNTPQLVSTYKDLLQSEVFNVNDCYDVAEAPTMAPASM